MTHQEFYENHFLIEGEKPPPLRDWQKKLLELHDLAENDPTIGGIVVARGRRYGYEIVFKSVQAKMEFEGKISLKEYLSKPIKKHEIPFGCD
jgi:hypothetical protein